MVMDCDRGLLECGINIVKDQKTLSFILFPIFFHTIFTQFDYVISYSLHEKYIILF